MKTQNRLKAIRTQRGRTAADLANRIGISRQTIYAMEAGSYVPNTTTALQLARELETTVEEIFQLKRQDKAEQERFPAEVLSSDSRRSLDRPVQLCRVDNRTVAVPASVQPIYLPSADGIASVASTRSAMVAVFPQADFLEKRVLVAGCDPGISLLRDQLQRTSGTEMVIASSSSRQALEWLKDGKVHVAGSHLRDSRTQEFNLPVVQRLLPGGGYRVVTFAMWEEGLVVPNGNPKGIRSVADLARKDVWIMNRPLGAGSRDLLDKSLKEADIPVRRVRGYEREADGHLAAARAVSSGEVDCCLATRSAAKAFGLDFIPLAVERYDLITLKKFANLPGIEGMLDVLNRAALRRKLEMLAGYDTAHTGEILV
jgi:molybdate-binding protein/DNA-binding XRE family transcriptional regulator